MVHGSFFSGIRGFELAAYWMGWQNAFSCEINGFCNAIGKYYFPETIIHTDIKTTDFTQYANTIDILTGGFPCQPYSAAGKRLGTEDERHLWPEMLRGIREISPRWILGENVRGLTNWNGGVVFDEVQADLEAEGYEVTPFLLPAVAVNAPHRRDRIWFVAYAGGVKLQKRAPERNCQDNAEKRKGLDDRFKRPGDTRNAAHPHELNGNNTGFCASGLSQQQKAGIRPNNAANTHGGHGETQRLHGILGKPGGERPADGCAHVGHPNNWQSWPTQSPLCNGNDGLSSGLDTAAISFSKWRNESIKAGGNAIVPQVALEIFKAIQAYENEN